MDLDAPPGTGCMGGGVPRCGLSAGAPSEPVESGPVHPWGCSWPLLSGSTGVARLFVFPLCLGRSARCPDDETER
jgi:hypothetical protein